MNHIICKALSALANIAGAALVILQPLASAYSALPPCDPNTLPWTRFSRYSAISDDAFRIKTDNCGNVYTAGTTSASGNLIDIFVIKYNSEGDTLWAQTYNGRDSGFVSQDKFGDLEIDTAGNVYITSAAPSFQLGTYDLVTIKYSPDGTLLWLKKLNFRFEDIPLAMCSDNSGNVFVTGYARESGGSPMYITVKYNSSGDTAWTRSYTGENFDGSTARDICIDASGNVYVSGNSAKFAQGNDYVTIKYSSAGTVLWTRRYNYPLGNSQDIPTAMVIDASSNITITGYSDSSVVGYQDFLTVRYNSNGDQLWTARTPGSGGQDDYALDLAVSSTGNTAVTGYARNSSGNYDMVTVLYNSSGVKQWQAVQAGTGNYHDIGRSVAFDASGNVYAAGNLANANSDAVVFKYNSSGIMKGQRIFNGTYNNDDVFRDISVDNLGNVHVAGRMNYTNFDCYSVTRKYPQNEFGFTLKLNAILQGFHYSSSSPFMRQDTVKVFVRSSTSPYSIIDSSKQVLNNVGYGEFFFTNLQTGVNYYISVKHRNSIDTWSASGSWISFSSDTASYNFTNAITKAFGSNMKQVNSSPVRFAFFSGDVNRDETIDATDISRIDNDALFFLSGYVDSDITGDGFVDGTDFAIADNNAANFVSVIRP